MKRQLLVIMASFAALSMNAQPAGMTLPEGFELPKPTPNDTLKSVSVNPDGSTTFRIYAPKAREVKLGGDMAGFGANATKFVQRADGVWEGTSNDKRIGSFRYNFVVDGVEVNDPKAVYSKDFKPLVDVDYSGDAFWQMKDVPHGAVSQIWYHSNTFNTTRRMHIWTPAGYQKNSKPLPVLYLIHGGGDNDASWPNVGKAGFILDNLMAEGKMVPMVVVMPDGSVPVEQFTDEIMNDIIPYVEANYNVKTDSRNRALAGLSMGGLETLDISLKNPSKFAYVFPLSTGWIGDAALTMWDEYLSKHASEMKSFKLYKFYMGGEADIAYSNCIPTRAIFDKYGIKHEYSSMEGGHSWYVWRHNLYDLVPLLFK